MEKKKCRCQLVNATLEFQITGDTDKQFLLTANEILYDIGNLLKPIRLDDKYIEEDIKIIESIINSKLTMKSNTN